MLHHYNQCSLGQRPRNDCSASFSLFSTAAPPCLLIEKTIKQTGGLMVWSRESWTSSCWFVLWGSRPASRARLGASLVADLFTLCFNPSTPMPSITSMIMFKSQHVQMWKKFNVRPIYPSLLFSTTRQQLRMKTTRSGVVDPPTLFNTTWVPKVCSKKVEM